MGRKFPAICFDIDGVLYRGKKLIPGADQVIRFLQEHGKIPFLLLTNGGGIPESERADVVNGILGLEGRHRLQGEQMVLCHTPFKRLVPDYKNKLIVVGGLHRPVEVAQLYGFEQVIDILEYSSVFPQLCNLGNLG